ncbi:MAG: ABC transporter ATP-binding protein [Capsulimonadaceae bacterium]|nr:ABC transporter ATP-binding protein [Capsulimonadaceae bacterium]
MPTLIDAAPESVLSLDRAQQHADPNVQRDVARADARRPVVVLEADIAEHGVFGPRWLIVDHASVRVYNSPADAAASLAIEIAIEDIVAASVEHYTGCGNLLIRTRSGALLEAVRYTPSRSRQFGVAARVIEALAQGEPVDKLLEIEVPQRKCEKCGAPLENDTQVCPFCIDRRATLSRLATYARPYIARVSLMVILSFLGTALGLISPILTTKVLTDKVLIPHQHRDWIVWLVLGALALGLAGTGLNVWRGRVAAWLSNHMVFRIRTDVYNKLHTLSVSYFDKRQVGSLLTRVTQDVNELQSFLVDGIQIFFVNILTIIGVFTVMFRFNPLLTIIAAVPMPITIYLTRKLVKRLHTRLHRMYYLRSSLGGLIAAALSGIRVVKAFNQEQRERQRFGAKATDLFQAQLLLEQTWQSFFPMMATIATSGTYLIFLFGGQQVFDHAKLGGTTMTLGTLQLFLVYLGILMGPIQQLSRIADWISRSTAAAERVFEVLDATVDVANTDDAVKMPQLQGRVELRDVRFSYDHSTDVLKGISLTVEPGEMIGLVGHSGAGKSTMINLLSRFYDVSEGAILVDGVDIREIDINDLRRQIGVVLQEPFLFPGTIRDNIAYARKDATFEQIMRAAKHANAHDFILRTSDGYDTYVGERGARLSGGERQRISIARAILLDPRILILDEATASVDTETEKKIQEAIGFLVKGRTTFAIAHRLSTLRNANRLVVLEKGAVAEIGTHEELLSMPDGVYRRLVDMQQAVNKIREDIFLEE